MIIDGMIELPWYLKQPDHLTAALSPQAVRVPKADLLKAADKALDKAAGHTSSELLNPTLETDDYVLPKVLAIPEQLLPLLIDEPSPRIALECINKDANLFSDKNIRKERFDPLLAYFCTACIEQGGRGGSIEL